MDDRAWEEAFVVYGLDAAVGRLFRGLTHNLNGVAQVFSMQTELMGMFFSRAGEILQQIDQAKTLEEAQDLGRTLAKFLQSRATQLPHLEKEVGLMQKIMRRVKDLMEGRGGAGANVCSLGAIISTELEFMDGDPFFKHRVRRDLRLEDKLPLCCRQFLEIHQILGFLLENCSQALADTVETTEPAVQINCTATAKEVTVRVADNGPGVAEADFERIFAPFYTSRPGHLGMGLYLARRLAERCGGSLACRAVPAGALFTLRLPVEEAEVGS